MIPFCSKICIAKSYLKSVNPDLTPASNTLESIAARIDSYFNLGHISKVILLHKIVIPTKRKALIIYTLSKEPSRQSNFIRILKILSFLLIIPLVIAFVFKCIIRLALYCKSHFYKSNVSIEPPELKYSIPTNFLD
ncbi:hypothetical protein C10C_0138 [Chlamydia serpentis]|uniref:Uncharacterized protein n=1 Tax=Chlamydia serpentis TaxID=1967782 RepID=A0A2R8FA71_9CHLA|nr:hypothetical protein C10C_0138 [Chlamydia serpentis]